MFIITILQLFILDSIQMKTDKLTKMFIYYLCNQEKTDVLEIFNALIESTLWIPGIMSNFGNTDKTHFLRRD